MTRDEAPFIDVPVMAPQAGQAFDVLLMPVSRPDLGEIRIDEDLFAIGRGEAPFAAYPTDAVSVLSRRHARIFSEDGAVYVADLGSKNGTRVNGDTVAQQPARLADGDEVSFGADLAYRVRLYPRPAEPEPPRVAVTLAPAREDLGLQPVVIAGFPFMVSKADDTFARYRDSYPHQVNYLSRRHAHVFLKHGVPWIEDLGSTNGTFVNGVRLRDQSVRLEPDDVVAFGGSHFVYRVGIERETDADATATRTSLAVPQAAPPANGRPALPHDDDPDKTTFVGAADSFLDIFCMDYPAAQEDEVNPEAPPDAADPAHPPAPRGRVTMMVLEAMRSFGIRDRHQLERAARVAILAIAVLVIGGGYLWWRGAPDRSLQALVDEGKYVRAAEVADKVLSRHPDEARYQTLGAEALMRAYVPQWSARLQAADYAGATAVLGEMRARSQHNAEGQALVAQLAWVDDLERYVAARGGIDGPIRMYADEAKIRGLLRRWGDDTPSHQRLLNRIANDVPPFRDTYARAMSDLRRLQNDESVSLAAIDRLNANIAVELGRDQPEALQPMLAEYKDRYPRLVGLDGVESDLRQYTSMIESLRDRTPGPLVTLMQKASFVTPPFQAAYQKLKATRLPGDEVQKQYVTASKAWDQGDGAAALGVLKTVTAGPWAADVARDAAHKEKVLAQYAAIKAGRGSPGYDEQLLAVYESLDPKADAFFARGIDADVNGIRDTALRRANQLLNRAATGWRQYRNNGLIAGEQRLEAGISAKFRAQAKLLADAQDDARQGLRIYAQLKIEDSAQWNKVRDDIQAEIDTQRRSLNDLRMVLDPAVLKGKLALLGEGSKESSKESSKDGSSGASPASAATAAAKPSGGSTP